MIRSRLSRHVVSGTLMAGLVLGALAAPAPAAASTAKLVQLSGPPPCKYDPMGCTPPPPETALVYLGGSEANRVDLRADAQGLRISDPGARIVAGEGCSRGDDHNVSCSVPSVLVYVATGAGRDRVKSQLGSASRLTVDGGGGDDVLVGGPGRDALLGGPGTDRLRGSGGDDRLFDASSRNPLRAGDPSPGEGGSDVFFGDRRRAQLPPGRGRDSFAGGPGNDTLDYEGRRDKLRIDLAARAAISGARGEHDSIRDIENATGGTGDDRIAGNLRANKLEGDPEPGTPSSIPGGDDRIVGRGGADTIGGGDGRNVIVAGPGNDTIRPHGPGGGRPNRIACGSGTDSTGALLALDFLAPDCEKPGFDYLDVKLGGPLDVRSLLPLRKGRPPRVLGGNLGCFLDFVCEVRAQLRVRGPGQRHGTAPPRGTLLGSQSFTIGAREVKAVDLRLSSTGLRRLRRHRALRVSVSIATQHSHRSTGYVTLLRAP